MIRGASISILTLGTAWLLAGLGAVLSNSDAGKQHEIEVAEAIEMTSKMSNEMIEEAKKGHDELAQDALEQIEKLEARLAEKQKKVDEVSLRYDEPLAEKLAKKEDAVGEDNTRLVGRLEKQIARLESRRDSALRRPNAARDKAADAVKEAKTERDEALAEAKAEIAAVQKRKTEQLASTTKEMEALKPETGVLGPAVATILGLGLLAFGGLGLARTPRAPTPVAKPRTRTPPSVPESVTLDAPPAIASEEVEARHESPKDQPTLADVPKEEIVSPVVELSHTGEVQADSPRA